MENMDDETRADVMAQIMHMTQQAEGGMPGGFGEEREGGEDGGEAGVKERGWEQERLQR